MFTTAQRFRRALARESSCCATDLRRIIRQRLFNQLFRQTQRGKAEKVGPKPITNRQSQVVLTAVTPTSYTRVFLISSNWSQNFRARKDCPIGQKSLLQADTVQAFTSTDTKVLNHKMAHFGSL